MTKLIHKAALVTGAAHRIGRHVALDLASRGMAIAIHHNNSDEDAEQVVQEIQAFGGSACCIKADLNDHEQTGNLIAQAQNGLHQTIDVLINNASVFEQDSIISFTSETWERHQRVNLQAPMILTQSFAAALPSGLSGSIINFIDQRVLKLNPLYMSYTLSKAGLFAATKTTAQALAHQGIRVNAIGPGPTLPNTTQTAAEFAKESASVPLGAGPTLEEIASAVRFMLETPSMTGQMIALDGGQHLAWHTEDIL